MSASSSIYSIWYLCRYISLLLSHAKIFPDWRRFHTTVHLWRANFFSMWPLMNLFSIKILVKHDDSRNLWYEKKLERWYSTILWQNLAALSKGSGIESRAWHIVFFFIILLWNDMDLYFYTPCWSVLSSRNISIQYNNTPARIHNLFLIWFSFLEVFCIRPDCMSQQTRDWWFSFSVTSGTWLIFTFALYLHFSVMLNSIY